MNHHPGIVDYKTFMKAKEQRNRRTVSHYRGIKKFDNVYSGLLFCGDCGAPMFSMSRSDLKPAYTCGTYHRRGRNGCTSHHTRVDILDHLVKRYVQRVRDNSSAMIDMLTCSMKNEKEMVRQSESAAEALERQIFEAKEQLKTTAKQKIREITKKPDQAEMIEEMYNEIEQELTDRIKGLQNQFALAVDRRNSVIQMNREAKTVFEIFDDILKKPALDKADLEILIDKIIIYEDHIDIKLKPDIDNLLRLGIVEGNVNFQPDSVDNATFTETVIQSAHKRPDKVYTVNVISSGPLLSTLKQTETFCLSLHNLSE